MNDVLTVRQAADRLGVTPGRVRQLITAGSIRASYLTPRMMLIDVKELARYKRPKMGRPVKVQRKQKVRR